MNTSRRSALWAATIVLVTLVGVAPEARADWNYRNGFGYRGGAFDLRLNLFVQPRYEYLSDDGSGRSTSTFALNLAGGRLRVRIPRRRITIQASGGLSTDQGVLLDTYLELGLGDHLGLRFGYFRVPFDEQTTHFPLWLRMTGRSPDVTELAHGYDLGVALRGHHLNNALVWGLSMTNGETSWTNGNIDFLYSLRLALRLGPLLDWYDEVDLVIGLGSSWNLEPWEPVEGERVNRSVFNETLDLTLHASWFSASLAGLYRLTDLGAYGEIDHGLGWQGALGHAVGWHLELAAALVEFLEVAARVAQLTPVVADDDRHQFEVAAAINGFGDEGRMRFQLEYSYLVTLDDDQIDHDAHRVVVQIQAFY